MKEQVPASQPPPSARIPQYQELALKAEKVVPRVWWREGFADDKLLLSRNNDELPKKLYDGTSTLSNKKLKNIYQCVTRQQFMRKAYDFQHFNNTISKREKVVCMAMDQQVVKDFHKLWSEHSLDLDGSYTVSKDGKNKLWYPNQSNRGQLIMAASEVMEHFYLNYGGVWTGCFALEKFPECRGALAGKL